MTRTRRTLAFATAALAATVAVPAFAGSGANLVQYVPSGTQMVVGVNVDSFRGSSVYTQALGILEATPDFQSAMSDLGEHTTFDPRTDIHSIVLASNVVSENSGDQMILLVEATLNEQEIMAALAAEGEMQPQTVGTVTYYTDGEYTLALLADDVIALGTPNEVMPAISAAAGTGTTGPGAAIASQVQATGHSGDLWFATMAPADVPELTAMRGSVSLASGVSASLTAVTSSQENAAALLTALNTQIAALQGDATVAQFGLGSAVQSISAAQNGNDVTITAAIDAGTWNTLLQTFGAILASELN